MQNIPLARKYITELRGGDIAATVRIKSLKEFIPDLVNLALLEA